MPLLRSLLSAGDHVHIYNNPRLRLSDFMRETFQTAVLADPTDHSSSTIHIKTAPPILIARNPITSIELAVYIVRSSYNQPVVIRNNKFLCEKFIEKWQKLLLTMRKVPEAHKVILLLELLVFGFNLDHIFDSDNIDEEYNWLVEHLHDGATKAESLQVAKRRLSSKTLELIRQRRIGRATGIYQQTSELAKLCREAIKEHLKERRAAIMDEAAEPE
nr:hypothetical protein HCOI_00700000 [Haemonchus contortus]